MSRSAPTKYSVALKRLQYWPVFRLVCVGVVSLSLVACNTTKTSSPNGALPGANWQVTFADEFDKTTLDTNKWDSCFYFVDNFQGAPGCTQDGLANVYRSDDVFTQADGTLYLQAQKRSTIAYNKPYTYSTGMLSSFAHYSFQYGFAEIRAKAAKGQGLWNAFWLMPASKKWPPEIDVLEILGHQTNIVYTTLHYIGAPGENLSSGQPFSNTLDFAADFHTFGVNWTRDALVWYVDGTERFRQTEHVPSEPMYLITTLSVGDATSWPGQPDASTTFPAHMAVDYIRVYQQK